MADEPIFIETDMEQVKTDTRALFEQIAGRPLNPADVENLVLNVLIYRETLIRQKIQDAAVINLVNFSRAPIIDYIGEIVGAVRLAATRATTEFTINLVPGHGGVTIPQGTRIASTDGLGVFAFTEDITVLTGVNVATAIGACTVEGAGGNGYGVGIVSVIQDPYPYLSSVTNTLVTAGGAEQESDDLFRERIKLAPSQFTTAGSRSSYKYHAMSSTPAIIDCGVYSPVDTGIVYLWPLMNDGTVTPTQILDIVEAACSGERVRPLSDLVIVDPPTQVPYALVVDLIIFSSAVGGVTQQTVEDGLAAFTTEKRQKLGQDIIESQVKKICQIDGEVYKATLVGFVDIPILDNEYAYCTSITVNIVSSTNG